jgi:hypothetical protein
LKPKNNPGLDEASNDHQKFLADLRGELIAQWRGGRSWKDIAVIACVGVGTVQRFAEGTTVQPTAFTVKQLALAVGYRIALVPASMKKIQGEIG